MSDTIKFIHAADLHIDSPFKGIGKMSGPIEDQIKESTFYALECLVNQAIHHQVDFVLMAGDLFDYETRSLKAQIKLRRTFERLKECNIMVFVSHGNHDFLSGPFPPVEYPENVYVFSKDHVTSVPYEKEGRVYARIYGFSYYERAVTSRMANQYQRTDEDCHHIAMLHGSVDTNTDHDAYAPFTIGELKDREMDYWALGHIHKRSILSDSPYIIYPGNTQGRSSKETGEKGCYLVEMNSRKTEVNFLPTHHFRFEKLEVSVESPTLLELEQLLLEQKEKLRESGSAIVYLHIKGEGEKLKVWENEGQIEDLINLLNEDESLEKNWIWFRKVTVSFTQPWDELQLSKEQHFIGEVIRQSEEASNMDEWLAPLYRHRTARKHLARLSPEEKEDILQGAKELLLTKLMDR
ncbi:metallophosphoesterase family protein [Thalassobacillus pellis]|uniref:metallophosphoesterase family protein n=1 Tax=Thalassobacillus pellis TaxID=748008 RepID=UPI001961E438|nr:DNA repair exonuclease [Thalassobacillus pellis]MBM7554133.1 DNA repair exonuclease SbcCD nuclease subunit [Thalassobacillus pellis]